LYEQSDKAGADIYQARSQSAVLLNGFLAHCGVAPLDQALSLACASRLERTSREPFIKTSDCDRVWYIKDYFPEEGAEAEYEKLVKVKNEKSSFQSGSQQAQALQENTINNLYNTLKSMTNNEQAWEGHCKYVLGRGYKTIIPTQQINSTSSESAISV
jgi:hypothetical protein